MSFEGKANRKLANGQNIEDSEKRKWPKGLSAPALELNTIIFKHVYWYMQLISGERLQDHWSSGFLSRDTTVKVWDEASLTELRSLGGHTGSVTDVILLSAKQYGSLGK